MKFGFNRHGKAETAAIEMTPGVEYSLKINMAVQKAEEFLYRAGEAKQRIVDDNYVLKRSGEKAAMKRASMDLSKALVEIRR